MVLVNFGLSQGYDRILVSNIKMFCSLNAEVSELAYETVLKTVALRDWEFKSPPQHQCIVSVMVT